MTLIEVVISAAVVGMVVMGAMTAFDSAQSFTTNQQARSQANDLAQQDEDRLRGLQVSQLSGLNSTRTVTLNGNTFSITSTGQFETDATGASSCAANGSADYIKTTSTVTWPNIGTGQPVVAVSLITPPAGGSLIVQVIDGHGHGVPGMSLTGTGPQALSSTTGTDGCAIFGAINGGNYNLSVVQTGYVDKDGNTTPPASQQATTVIDGASDEKTFMFDRAGQISTTFDTLPYGASTAVASSTDQITIFNNNMTYPGFRWGGTANSFQSTVTANNVFPFPSGYTVYAGTCSADAPSAFGLGPDPSVTVTGGSTSSLLLHLPPINLTVYSGTSSLLPGSVINRPHVIIQDTGCGGTPPTAGGSPSVKRTPTTTTTGRLADPGMPFGTYTICADNGARKYTKTGVVNQTLTGTTVNLYLGFGSGSTSGVCT